MRSPISLTGSKHHQAPWIINNFPNHEIYVEVFGGGAHVLTQKSKSKNEIYNDINDNLVNFLMVARKKPEELYRACDSLPVSRSLFEKWKWDDWPDDKLERAVRWFYVMRQSFGGLQQHKSGWKASKTRNVASAYHNSAKLIKLIGKRFKNVAIENDDFRGIIARYDSSETLFYCDPPYIGKEHYYRGKFSKEDHEYLSALLNDIKGKAVVSYYECQILDELYAGWQRDNRKFVKYAGTEREFGNEVLLMNYKKNKMSLF
jgi:DNA adenine methylase